MPFGVLFAPDVFSSQHSKNMPINIFTWHPNSFLLPHAAHVGYKYNASLECGGAYPKGQCLPCQTIGVLISFWLRYTPEFQLIVLIFSSPVALLVAMWGMLGKRERAIMSSTNSKYSALSKKVAQQGTTDCGVIIPTVT